MCCRALPAEPVHKVDSQKTIYLFKSIPSIKQYLLLLTKRILGTFLAEKTALVQSGFTGSWWWVSKVKCVCGHLLIQVMLLSTIRFKVEQIRNVASVNVSFNPGGADGIQEVRQEPM